jgi:hypothetical protein
MISKYVFNIRCRNGAIVNNLKINGKTYEEAQKKVEQMYRYCEILQSDLMISTAKPSDANFEDVLELITK